MATASPPILIYTPGGGVPIGPASNPPVYSQKGTTQLIQGQAYIDVVFASVQTSNDWVMATLEVENTTDLNPLNIWPGIITNRTTAGFRLQLNGMPDSANYYLHWAVSGVNIAASPASTYFLTGPTSGLIGAGATFTVALPPSTTVPVTITVTPSDGGGGGTFAPTSMSLTTGSPSMTFTYTPASAGTKTISVTNDGGLSNPASISFVVSLPVATGYSLSGPSSGSNSVASTNFTVTLTPAGGTVTGTVTVTPSSGGGGGSFTPSTVGLTTGAPSATFTYTPSTTGAKTISVTNNGGLTDPGSLTYTVAGLTDGSSVSTWPDSSGNGHDATQSGSARPIFKTAIVGGKPVVRFASASSQFFNLASSISGAPDWTAFVVFKPVSAAVIHATISSATGAFSALVAVSDGNLYSVSRSAVADITNSYTGAFHVFSAMTTGTTAGFGSNTMRVDGTGFTPALAGASSSYNFDVMGSYAATNFSDGDTAEIIIYTSAPGGMSATDIRNIEKYLGTKYGITVAGGTAVDPSTVTGLLGWWKADSL